VPENGTCDRQRVIRFRKIDNRVFKHPDELVPDNFPFFLRISDAAQFGQKTLRRVHVFQLDVEIFAENTLHDFLLSRA